MSSVSLTLIFDFNPRNGLVVGQHKRPECEPGEEYYPRENVCRKTACQPGYVLDDSDCIPNPSNITVSVMGTFSAEPDIQTADTLNEKSVLLETNVLESAAVVMETAGVENHKLEVRASFSQTDGRLLGTIVIECSCDYASLNATGNSTEASAEFQNNLNLDLREEVLHFLLSEKVELGTIDVDVEVDVGAAVTPEENCTWLVYQTNETSTGNGSVTVVSTGRNYPPGLHQIVDDAVIVCESDFAFPDSDPDSISLGLGIVTLVCVGISIICLLLRIILQCIIPSFRNRPGKLHLQMAIALLIAFVMLIVGAFVTKISGLCTAAAVLLAYGFLAAFVWMNVIALDTWLVFRPSAAFSRASEEERSLVAHYIVGWGLPLLLVAVPVVMNYVDISNENFTPDFGGVRCWYRHRWAMLVYFGIPIAVSIILNIYLYIHTSINLRKAMKSTTNVSRGEGHHFGVYVRLFVLMGITWIFGFVSAFTDEVAVDFIFVILTSLQGLFLFISFVCTKSVLSEIRKMRQKRHKTSESSNKTGSTPLSPLPASSGEDKH